MVRNDAVQPSPQPPGDGRRAPLSGRLWEELHYHLFPWSPGFMRRGGALTLAGVGLAVAVTVVWVLAAAHQLAPATVIGWWTGWSVYEVLCRRRCKPWVKEGPWWGDGWRSANTVDLVSYVATKNLLVGVALFMLLKLLGLIPQVS